MTAQGLFCLMILLIEGVAWAGHPLLTDDTGVQGAGSQQLELNFDRVKSPAISENQTDSHRSSGNLTYTVGLNNRIDLYLNLPSDWSLQQNNMSLGSKLLLVSESGTSLGLKLSTKCQNRPATKGKLY